MGKLSGSLGLKKSKTTKQSSGESAKTSSSRLKIDEEGILESIRQALSGAGGLGAIFSEEQSAGLFDSSSAKAGTEDLLTKISGELARLTGETVTSEDLTSASRGSSTTRDKEAKLGFGSK